MLTILELQLLNWEKRGLGSDTDGTFRLIRWTYYRVVFLWVLSKHTKRMAHILRKSGGLTSEICVSSLGLQGWSRATMRLPGPLMVWRGHFARRSTVYNREAKCLISLGTYAHTAYLYRYSITYWDILHWTYSRREAEKRVNDLQCLIHTYVHTHVHTSPCVKPWDLAKGKNFAKQAPKTGQNANACSFGTKSMNT